MTPVAPVKHLKLDPENDGRETPYSRMAQRRFAAAILAPDAWPDAEPPIAMLVSALQIVPGRPTLVNGAGSIGKSILASSVGVCLLGGVAGLGGLVDAGPPRRVVHIDGDQGGRATRQRYRRLAAGLGVTARPTLVSLLRARAEGFDPARVADWSELLRGHDLAIVDSLSSVLAVADLDENSASDTKKILTALLEASSETSCAVVVISHSGHDVDDGKGNTSQRKRPRGSSAIFQGAGAIWTITGGTERGAVRTATLVRESEHSDESELVTSWRFAIVARGEALVVERVGGEEPPRAATTKAEKFKQTCAAVLQVVKDNPGCNARFLRSHLDGNNEMKEAAIEAMEQGGRIRILSKGSGKPVAIYLEGTPNVPRGAE